MYRIAFILAAIALSTLPARAQGQGLDGNIWSGVPSGLSGSFQTGLSGDFQAGFGARDVRRSRRTEDFTLGAGGGFRASMLRGQPSNFGPSVRAMTVIPDTTLRYSDGPETEVDLGRGPEMQLD